jgi:hypothetical protein
MTSRWRQAASVLFAIASPLWVLPRSASAWTASTRAEMADYAVQILPPDLERQVQRHQRRYREGALTGPTAFDPSVIEATVGREAEKAVRAIASHQPFSEIVFQLGVVAHWVALANDPLVGGRDRATPPEYRQDYTGYLEQASRRFAVLYYGFGRQVETPADLEALIARTLRRGRLLASMVDQEYRRVGAIDALRLFDDRSTAFGVGSLAFSHGVSDIAGVLRYIWVRAGGADTRGLPAPVEGHLILLARGRRAP